MRVRVLIFGALKDRLGSAAAAIELPKNATVADLPGRAGASRTAPQMPQAPRGMAESMNAEFATTAQLEPGTARGKSSHLPAHAAILGLALAALLAPPFTAQETTLRVDVRLVNIFVNVTDENGSIVGGLGRDDFAVTEDGRPQQIAVFERQSELPLNLTLAIDTSGSVHKDMAQEADAARRFAHAILRPQDQMSVLQFATNVRELTPFTNKVAQIDRGLAQLHGDWATALYDAIYLGSEKLGARDGRKVLILVSDGDDTAKNTTYQQALEAALRNEVMIYSIIDVPIEASAGRDLGGEHALITLAEQTGGKSFYESDGGLEKAFARVSDDLRTQYLLGYYPKSQEPGRAFHRLQVTIPRAAAQAFNIRHKTGYYMDAPAKGN
jgi:Ca-activated chloride channel family protein